MGVGLGVQGVDYFRIMRFTPLILASKSVFFKIRIPFVKTLKFVPLPPPPLFQKSAYGPVNFDAYATKNPHSAFQFGYLFPSFLWYLTKYNF